MSTTSPHKRIAKKVKQKFEPKVVCGDKESDPNTKTGSKYGEEDTSAIGAGDPVPKLHRGHSQKKHGSKKKSKNKKGVDMNSVVNTIRYILENHGKNIGDVISNYEDKEMLQKMAKKCLATCLTGWTKTEDGLVSENTNLVLSKNSWEISEDGSIQLKNGFKFNYDWLYDLSNNNIITEDIAGTELDKDLFADTLSNASNLLRKLSDKEIKKYVLNAAKNDEDIDLRNLKEILEDSGVNWKFIDAEIDGDIVNLFVSVRYTVDGTQDGVVEKKLSIEVKPSADVKEAPGQELDDDVDLDFPSETSRSPEESSRKLRDSTSEDLEAGLDIGVDLE